MTNEAIGSADHSRIQDYFTCPRRPDTDLAARIDKWIRNDLGLHIRCNEWFAPEACDVWQFAFNDRDENVPADPPPTPFDLCIARWTYRIAISHRGPLVTCETYSLIAERPDRWHDSRWRYDRPVRAKAVTLTQRIAAEFDLQYVDTNVLRDWKVSYDEVDPEFDLENDVLAVPTAFQVLFFE